MNNNRLTETSVKNVLSGMIDSYVDRDQNVAFSSWLADRLRQEMPEMLPEASEKLAERIIVAVADYDATLDELNNAVQAGVSKEEWLADHLADAYTDVPLNAAGEKLQMVETGFAVANMQLFGEISEGDAKEAVSAKVEPAEWNKYNVKDKAYEIGKQAALVGVAAAAQAIEDVRQAEETSEIVAAFGQAFQKNLKGEVKAVVAGAAKVAAEKGIGKVLPDTPIEIVCDMAGVAVEGAEALFDAANGDISMTAAVDKIGRAGVAAGCRAGRYALEGVVAQVPYVGPLLVNLLGGLFEHMESSQFYNNVYVVVRDAAKATWEGMKTFVGNKINSLLKVKRAVFG